MLDPLWCLVYVSSAVRKFSDAELRELLRESRERNHRCGITGMLLYHDGNFIQALEGPEEAVLSTFGRISVDPRHTGIIKLLHQPIDERQFPQSSMGFRSVGRREAQAIPGFSTFLHDAQVPVPPAPSRALRLLQSFRSQIDAHTRIPPEHISTSPVT